MFVCGLTSPPSRWDGCTLMFDVQSAGCVEDRVHEDVRLTLLQHVQHLLQDEEATWRGRRWGRWGRRGNYHLIIDAGNLLFYRNSLFSSCIHIYYLIRVTFNTTNLVNDIWEKGCVLALQGPVLQKVQWRQHTGSLPSCIRLVWSSAGWPSDTPPPDPSALEPPPPPNTAGKSEETSQTAISCCHTAWARHRGFIVNICSSQMSTCVYATSSTHPLMFDRQ